MEGHAVFHPVRSFQQGRIEDHRPLAQTKVISGCSVSKVFFVQDKASILFLLCRMSLKDFSIKLQLKDNQAFMRQTLLVVYLIPEFKSPGVQRAQNVKIKSEADRSLTKKVSEINMQHSQAGWASALHSLLCLNVTFNGHLPPQSI